MEPVSPMVNLKPGDKYSFSEDWYLFEYVEAKSASFNVKKVFLRI